MKIRSLLYELDIRFSKVTPEVKKKIWDKIIEPNKYGIGEYLKKKGVSTVDINRVLNAEYNNKIDRGAFHTFEKVLKKSLKPIQTLEIGEPNRGFKSESVYELEPGLVVIEDDYLYNFVIVSHRAYKAYRKELEKQNRLLYQNRK